MKHLNICRNFRHLTWYLIKHLNICRNFRYLTKYSLKTSEYLQKLLASDKYSLKTSACKTIVPTRTFWLNHQASGYTTRLLTTPSGFWLYRQASSKQLGNHEYLQELQASDMIFISIMSNLTLPNKIWYQFYLRLQELSSHY